MTLKSTGVGDSVALMDARTYSFPRHGLPVRSTQRMPLSSVRWSLAGRPTCGRCGGNSGRSRAHCRSSTSPRCGLMRRTQPARLGLFAYTL